MLLLKNVNLFSKDAETMNATNKSLAFLNPDSIAIIGASTKPEKRGYQAIARLLQDGFPQSGIYPINPKAPEILGVKAYSSVLNVDAPIDLALVCTPARSLPGVIEECGKKNIGCVVVLAAGFSEIGEEGKAVEQAMIDAGKKWNVRIIGPNTNGIFNLHKKANLVGVPDAEIGNIGLVSQSGNVTLGFITEVARKGGTGFSTFIGVGNQADLDFSDYIRYFADDENTSSAVLYVEGFKDGRKFLDSAREVVPQKPIVVFKSGRTAQGQISAASHTGSLAGSYSLTRDVLRQVGVTVVEETDNILPIAEALGKLPVAKGNRVAILTDGGGHGTIATDALVDAGLMIAKLSDETVRKLKEILPPAAALNNPVDVAGATDEDSAPGAIAVELLLQDENVDILMVTGMLGGFHRRFSETLLESELQAAKEISLHVKTYQKPVIIQSVYRPQKVEPLMHLQQAGLPVYIWVEPAVAAAKAVAEYGASCRRLQQVGDSSDITVLPEGTAIFDRAYSEGRSALFESEAKDLLRLYGLDVPPEIIIKSEQDLSKLPESLKNEPLAMKIVSEDILHKSDAGGVKLNVTGEEARKIAFQQILNNAKDYKADAKIEGVLLTPMLKSGVEVILGVTRDATFGPVLMFGLGGVFVEVLKDVTFRAIPLSKTDAAEMVEGIKAVEILNGVRGTKAIDRNALLDLIMKLSEMVWMHPEIAELDLNPVITRPDGVSIADARIILSEKK
ncbi:MAG: CoA-binding protein [Desulfobulbaceae bacterium]|nr:CoA-binding protein [Desulfobulbaceae bacterium]